MRKYIVDSAGKHIQGTEEAEPVCGEDFCERCGDCLVCYGYDVCPTTEGNHIWIEYEEKE